MMMKKCLLAVALLSLALAGGCAKGGNGIVPSVSVLPNNVSANQIYPGQTVTLTATTVNPAYAPVTWSLTGSGSITGSTPPDAANKISAMATYAAPTTVGAQATITATLTNDTSVTGDSLITVADVTTEVTPATLSVGSGLTQQFTAAAVPSDAPPTFTWTCTVGGVPDCHNFHQDPNVSSLAYYTYSPQDSCSGACVQVAANSTLDPTICATSKNCTVAKFSLVPQRLTGTYTFRFSGYNGNHATAVVGTFTVAANGTITGVEDELTSSGAQLLKAIQSGSYVPTAHDPNNSNNAGTLTLTTSASTTYQVVLDGAGDIEMIESDGNMGSGIAQKTASSNLFTGDQTYAFGFTGVDASGNRVGYVGVLPMDGNGNIVGGQMDVNGSSSVCTSPCTVTGTYQPNGTGAWHVALTAPLTMGFDIFIASGSNSKTNPLSFYAISTDPGTNPAVSGTMVLQDSTQTYNNAAFKGTSVSAVTGVVTAATTTCTAPPCSNVALTLGSTDGNGGFSGQFDQNNGGAIISAPLFPPTGSTSYTYTASGTNGRYTINMLGDPTQSTPIPPIPFVLYASGANRGFLLDQKSSSVMTGTMNLQGKLGIASNSELPGTYAAATTGSGSSDTVPVRQAAGNGEATQAGVLTFNISGTQCHRSCRRVQSVAGI